MKILIRITKEVLEKTAHCGIEGKTPRKLTLGLNCAISHAVRKIFPLSIVTGKAILIAIESPRDFLKRLTPDFSSLKPFVFVSPNGMYQIKLPDEARNFIKDFDDYSPLNRIAMKPISFYIDVPDEIIDGIGIRQVYKVLSESTTLELVQS